MYGPDAKTPGSFASNCILARRLAEKNVKFIQLYHPGWDHHGGLPMNYPVSTKEIDQPCAALIKDLKQRDMLKDTLVVWGGEFGRTSYSQAASAPRARATDAITTGSASPSGWPAAASKGASLTERRTTSDMRSPAIP
nr:DUF1501 domain-containing protein [Verrucomicrobium spinosum]